MEKAKVGIIALLIALVCVAVIVKTVTQIVADVQDQTAQGRPNHEPRE